MTVGIIIKKLRTDKLRERRDKEKLLGFHRGESLAHRGERRPGQLGTPARLSLLSKKFWQEGEETSSGLRAH